MAELQIADISLKLPQTVFEEELQNIADDWSEHMNYEVKSLRTKHGKTMFKIHVNNGDGDEIDLVSEQDDVNGDMIFHPIKLSNMGESFYQSRVIDSHCGEDLDPTMFLCHALEQIALKHKGTFACIDSRGNTTLVREGNPKRRASLAIVDSDGTVYSCTNAKNVKGESDDIEFTVRKPIGEWLNENHDVQTAIQGMDFTDKMNYVGKHLIAARLADEIDSDEFVDIFRQAGVIGFSDASVLNIYKLLM